MTWAMSPRTRGSSTSIRLVLDSRVIPRVTRGSPPLIHHPHHRRPPGRLHLALHLISRTRCSLSLTVLTPFGTRHRSTESSLPRTWRPFALTCVPLWPTRPPFSISTGPPGPARPITLTPPATTTVTRPITREVSFTLYCSFIASGYTGHFFFWGVWVVIGFLLD